MESLQENWQESHFVRKANKNKQKSDDQTIQTASLFISCDMHDRLCRFQLI